MILGSAPVVELAPNLMPHEGPIKATGALSEFAYDFKWAQKVQRRSVKVT